MGLRGDVGDLNGSAREWKKTKKKEGDHLALVLRPDYAVTLTGEQTRRTQ